VLERRPDPAVKAPELAAVESGRRPQRVEPCPPQRLVDIDVPHPGEGALVEERGLERGAATGEPLAEACGGEERVQRLVPDLRGQVGLHLPRFEQEPGAETADVPIGHSRPVVQGDESAAVRIVRKRAARQVQKAPGHPEVDQENAAALEPDDQILPTPLDCRDAFPPEFGRDLRGVVRPYEPTVVDRDRLEAPADEGGLQLPADALDLRQLRHGASTG